MPHQASACNFFNQRSIQSRFNYGQNRPAGNHLGDVDLLGFTLRGQYFVDKIVPMGLQITCECWQCLAKFLNWLVSRRTGSDNIDHYLDDFFFAGESYPDKCQLLMLEFSDMCKELGAPIAQKKKKGLLLLWYTWLIC